MYAKTLSCYFLTVIRFAHGMCNLIPSQASLSKARLGFETWVLRFALVLYQIFFQHTILCGIISDSAVPYSS